MPAERPTKKTKKRTNVLFPPRAMPVEKERSFWGEGNNLPVLGLLVKQGVPIFGLIQLPREQAGSCRTQRPMQGSQVTSSQAVRAWVNIPIMETVVLAIFQCLELGICEYYVRRNSVYNRQELSRNISVGIIQTDIHICDRSELD